MCPLQRRRLPSALTARADVGQHPGAALGRFDPPPLPAGPAELWNGDGESGDGSRDHAADAVPVQVLPGVTTDDIDAAANGSAP
jgi:hypothetical protein